MSSNFIQVTAVDDAGLGIEFSATVRESEVVVVMTLGEQGPAKAKSLIILRGKDSPMFVTEEYDTLRALLGLVA